MKLRGNLLSDDVVEADGVLEVEPDCRVLDQVVHFEEQRVEVVFERGHDDLVGVGVLLKLAKRVDR